MAVLIVMAVLLLRLVVGLAAAALLRQEVVDARGIPLGMVRTACDEDLLCLRELCDLVLAQFAVTVVVSLLDLFFCQITLLRGLLDLVLTQFPVVVLVSLLNFFLLHVAVTFRNFIDHALVLVTA